MLWTVKQAAAFLGIREGGVYYLIYFACIEAVKVGGVWRVTPDSARAYGAKRAARKNGLPAGGNRAGAVLCRK